jgi:cytochrome d ubiquinol oxidase subunit II
MTPEALVLLYLGFGLILYMVLAGADFGAGIWELLVGARETPQERALVYKAIGPVWEANHVWLIFIFVILWTAFPTAFAAISRALWLPLLLALAGIVFRGAAYGFRYASPVRTVRRRRWEATFAAGSTATPFFFGASVGAVASGQLPITPEGHFEGSFLTDWISPFSIFCGAFAVTLCGYLAAVYLAREAGLQGPESLAALWRRRALRAGAATGVLALAGLPLMAWGAPELWAGFSGKVLMLTGLFALASLGSLGAVATGRPQLAVGCSGLAAALVVAGWGLAQYPLLIPPAISVASARAPEGTMRALAWCVAVGGVLTAPALLLLFSIFKSEKALVHEVEKEDESGATKISNAPARAKAFQTPAKKRKNSPKKK